MPIKLRRYLALGDSYTIGESVSQKQRWPNQLVERLKSAGIECSEPTILAKTGWTTADLLNALDESKITGSYDLVTLLIGVNNQYQNIDLRVYQLEFVQILQRAITYTGGDSSHVIVLSIPDWSVTPFASDHDRLNIKSQIDRFNIFNENETKLAEAIYMDITNLSRQAGRDPSLLSGDRLHPSAKMYALWVDLIFRKACRILNKHQEGA